MWCLCLISGLQYFMMEVKYTFDQIAYTSIYLNLNILNLCTTALFTYLMLLSQPMLVALVIYVERGQTGTSCLMMDLLYKLINIWSFVFAVFVDLSTEYQYTVCSIQMRLQFVEFLVSILFIIKSSVKYKMPDVVSLDNTLVWVN